MGTSDAGLKLWPGDADFIRYQHEPGNPNSLYSDTIEVIKEDHRGIIWIGTPRGLNRLYPETKKITRVAFPEFVHPHVFKIFIDNKGKLWLATGNNLGNRKLITYDPATGSFHHYFKDAAGRPILPYENHHVFSIVEDDQNRIWMGNSYGIYLFNSKNKKVTNYLSGPRNPESLSDDNVRPIA